MVENRLERRVLKRGAVDISCNPVIVKHGMALRHHRVSFKLRNRESQKKEKETEGHTSSSWYM